MAETGARTVPVDELAVHVGKLRYTGWETASLTRPLDAVSGSFNVSYPTPHGPLPIKRGDAVKIWLGQDLLLTGHVDRIQGSLGGKGFSISGRDVTADLVDCTAENLPGQFDVILLDELVDALAAPFSIPVRVDESLCPEPAPILTFTLQSETAWQAIERACRLSGTIAFTTGDGRIHLARPGAGRDAEVELVEGVNLLAASVDLNNADRYQFYTVEGQRSGSDSEFGEAVALVRGVARDDDIGRYRPLLVTAEGSVTFASATERAEWEATFRRARSSRCKATVVGWRQTPGGRVWRVNENVVVRAPTLGLKSKLLINRVDFKRGTGGTFTTLELLRPGAYTPEPQESAERDPFAAFSQAGE